MNLKKILTSLVISVAAFCAVAAENPVKDLPRKVEVHMPYGPGGVVDQQVRHLQQYLGERGVTLVVNYKPGGEGILAAQDLLSAPKDGSVIGFFAAGMVANAENHFKQQVANPLTIAGITVKAFIAKPNSKYSTVDALETALKSGDPRLEIAYHSPGDIFVLSQYKKRLSVDKGTLTVPFKTPVQITQSIIGGHVQVGTVPMAVAAPLAQQGQIEIILVAGPREVKLPNGTVNLAARYKGWRHPDGFMFVAPVGMSAKMTEVWLDVLKAYLTDQSTKDLYDRAYLGHGDFGPQAAVKLVEQAGEALKK